MDEPGEGFKGLIDNVCKVVLEDLRFLDRESLNEEVGDTVDLF